MMAKRQRPELLQGTTRKVKTGCGNLYITVTKDETGNPFEVFTSMGKAGGCASAQCEAISRLVSLALRCGIETGEIVKQLKGISCHQNNGVKSCADAIGITLEENL